MEIRNIKEAISTAYAGKDQYELYEFDGNLVLVLTGRGAEIDATELNDYEDGVKNDYLCDGWNVTHLPADEMEELKKKLHANGKPDQNFDVHALKHCIIGYPETEKGKEYREQGEYELRITEADTSFDFDKPYYADFDTGFFVA